MPGDELVLPQQLDQSPQIFRKRGRESHWFFALWMSKSKQASMQRLSCENGRGCSHSRLATWAEDVTTMQMSAPVVIIAGYWPAKM